MFFSDWPATEARTPRSRNTRILAVWTPEPKSQRSTPANYKNRSRNDAGLAPQQCSRAETTDREQEAEATNGSGTMKQKRRTENAVRFEKRPGVRPVFLISKAKKYRKICRTLSGQSDFYSKK